MPIVRTFQQWWKRKWQQPPLTKAAALVNMDLLAMMLLAWSSLRLSTGPKSQASWPTRSKRTGREEKRREEKRREEKRREEKRREEKRREERRGEEKRERREKRREEKRRRPTAHITYTQPFQHTHTKHITPHQP